MSAMAAPASAADAVEKLQTLAGYLADLDSASLPAAALAACLVGMEQAAAVARARMLAAYDAQGGHLADGQRSVGAWLVHMARVTRAAAAQYKAIQALARDHEPLLAGLRTQTLMKSVALQLAKWTQAIPEEFRAQAEEIPAPRGALSYSRFSREEFGGYSWA